MPPSRTTRSSSTVPGTPKWLVVDRDLVDSVATLKGMRGCPIRWNEQKKKNAKKISGVVIKEEGEELIGVRVLARYALEHTVRAPVPESGSAAAAAVTWLLALTPESAFRFGALATLDGADDAEAKAEADAARRIEEERQKAELHAVELAKLEAEAVERQRR